MLRHLAVGTLSMMLLVAPQAMAQEASIHDGVYTAEQAQRGAEVHKGSCASCHGLRLDGAALNPDKPSTPPLARDRFLRKWDGRSLAELFEFTKTTMPQINPGSLSDQQYIDAIAHMLAVSGMPEGDTELPPDSVALGEIMIEAAAE